MRIDKMDDRWVDDKANASNVLWRNLLTASDKRPITHLSHVLLPELRFLQSDDVVVDVLCSVEKSVEVGVCGDCPGVVGAEHEAISMACRPGRRVVFVQSERRPEYPDIVLATTRRRRRDPMCRVYFYSSIWRSS